ncbi:MAG TPA: DUF333 domain-containing protein, partial [Vicinamibacterales bacterium]|nr:DUF333 domain-containing protein [Vicinamibacterales bacterium]
MSSCARKPAPTESPATSTASPAATAAAPTTAAEAQLANPASTHCVEQGGKLGIERRPDGAEFGVCFLEDNRQCEEWALLRGECPPTGAKITGYNTQAGRYCAITGGRYAVTG